MMAMREQTASVAFREVTGLNAWCVDVVVDGDVCGHIYRGGDGYRYFEGPRNDIIWSFADRDVDRLKARVEATVIAERVTNAPPAVRSR
jgi:hypothetical protein